MAQSGESFGGTARFEVVRRLGGGGMGVVYEAIDRETRRRVALKTLRSMSAEALLLFKNEFRALADIHHPNLVSLGELLEEGGRWFFTMELVEGEHLLANVVVPPSPPLIGDEESTPDLGLRQHDGPRSERVAPESAAGSSPQLDKLRAAVVQLARALSALHDANKVHRDVKPSNVIVTPEGRVVVLDFGVIAEATTERTEGLVGTISYMAPEQASGERTGPAADWYSLGVILYQALTGVLPVRGTLKEIAVLKRILEPPPPSSLAPGIPRDLDALCVDLLKIDPRARPSGRDVLRRLGVDDTAVATPGPVARFVGRREETAKLRAAFDEVKRGATVTVLVRGDSGVGKSALVKRFADGAAASDGALVFSSRCYERETVPFKAVDGVVDALSRHLAALPDEDARSLLPRHAAVAAQVFPVLRKAAALARAPVDEASDPHLLRARLFAALRELLARIAARRTLVVCIDDLQWADADGLALLAAILRPPDAPPLLLVATVRSATETESGPTTTGPIAAAIPGRVIDLPILSLPAADARELVSDLLGSDSGSGVDAIAAEAGGHPLFIDELVRRRLSRSADAGPLRLEDALWARIQKLEPEVRRLLEVVVVAGAPIAQESAADAADVDAGDLGKHVSLLRAANLARTTGPRRTDAIEAYHDRVRAAVTANLERPAKRAHHERLAAALERAPNPDVEALAVHWREAGDAPKAAGYALRAADDAGRALAFDRAARLYRMSLELAPKDGAEGAAIRTRLGEALANAGRGAEAAAAYLDAAQGVATAEALDLRRRAAEQLLHAGHIDDALAAFDDVLAAVGLHAPRGPKESLALLLARRTQLRLRGLSFTEREASALAAEQLTRVDACWAVGVGLGLVDAIRGSYFQTRALLLALEAGEPRRVVRSLAGEVAFSSADGGRGVKRTASLLVRARELAVRVADPYTSAWTTGSAGIAATLEGRWSVALAECDAAEAAFRDKCTGAVWEMGTMRWFALWGAAYLGRVAEVSRRTTAGLREAEARGNLYATVCCSTGLATLTWLAADDPEAARAHCRSSLRAWSQRGFHVEHWWAMLAERQINLYAGDAAAAHAAVTAAWPALSDSLLLMVQLTELEALHLRARTALAAASTGTGKGDAEKLLAAAAADARKIKKAAMPWSDPLADLVLAGCARGDAAVKSIDAAIAGLDAAGMALYAAAACRRKAALVGGDAGRALLAESDAWFAAEGVKRPDRMTAMLAPGFRT